MEEVSINGVRVTGLVDTGARMTTVKLSWFESNLAGKMPPYRVSIALNAASREPLLGVSTTPWSLETTPLPQSQ